MDHISPRGWSAPWRRTRPTQAMPMQNLAARLSIIRRQRVTGRRVSEGRVHPGILWVLRSIQPWHNISLTEAMMNVFDISGCHALIGRLQDGCKVEVFCVCLCALFFTDRQQLSFTRMEEENVSWLVAHKHLGPTRHQIANVDPQLTRHERE